MGCDCLGYMEDFILRGSKYIPSLYMMGLLVSGGVLEAGCCTNTFLMVFSFHCFLLHVYLRPWALISLCLFLSLFFSLFLESQFPWDGVLRVLFLLFVYFLYLYLKKKKKKKSLVSHDLLNRCSYLVINDN